MSDEVDKLFQNNKVEDLKWFMSCRSRLNKLNMAATYMFHTVQAAGILTTTIATGYNEPVYIWVGIGLNVLASLISVFEQTNNNISGKMLKDITAIREGKYIDEGVMVEADKVEKQPAATAAPAHVAIDIKKHVNEI